MLCCCCICFGFRVRISQHEIPDPMKKELSVVQNEDLVALQPQPDPVRVEKNLNSLGFFATTYKRTGLKPVRNIECGTREIEGKRTTQKARIAGDADLGLPAGADRSEERRVGKEGRWR